MRLYEAPGRPPVRRAVSATEQRLYDILIRRLRPGLVNGLSGRPWAEPAARRFPPREFYRLAELRAVLRTPCSSVYGEIDPALALRFQSWSGNEMALDWIVERATGRCAGLVTRGEVGIAVSDLLLYYRLDKRFLVRTGFHTHPENENHLGRHMPSLADFCALRGARLAAGPRSLMALGSRSPVASVYFADGVRTRYALLSDRVGVVRTGQGPRRRVHLAMG